MEGIDGSGGWRLVMALSWMYGRDSMIYGCCFSHAYAHVVRAIKATVFVKL